MSEATPVAGPPALRSPIARRAVSRRAGRPASICEWWHDLRRQGVPARRNATTAGSGPVSLIYKSRDGRIFRPWRLLPDHDKPGWRRWQSDLYLVRRRVGFDVYYAGRPGPSGADLGVGRHRNGRWSHFVRILERAPGRWDGVDLGEPAVFRLRGGSYMLYVGLGRHGGSRQIGLARWTGARWERCRTSPLIPAGGTNAPKNAIDPEPLVRGDHLYVYFGGGRTVSLGGNMDGAIVLRTYRLSS